MIREQEEKQIQANCKEVTGKELTVLEAIQNLDSHEADNTSSLGIKSTDGDDGAI